MVQGSYPLYANGFSLMATGWVPGDVPYKCFSVFGRLTLLLNRLNAGVSAHFRATRAICDKGLSGIPNILPRTNFGVGGQEGSPLSIAAHSLN